MARGWESKSVESQQAEAESSAAPPSRLSPREQESLSLELTRKRILQEIGASTNPRFRELKTKALSHIEAKIALLNGNGAAAAAKE